MGINYGELLFDAVKTISDNSISKVSYDETIIGTIIEVDKNISNRYLVDCDTMTFYAYATEGVEYEINKRVQVLVPQGDFVNEKKIIGLVSSAEEITDTVTADRFGQFVPLKTITKEIDSEQTMIEIDLRSGDWPEDIDYTNPEYVYKNENYDDAFFYNPSIEQIGLTLTFNGESPKTGSFIVQVFFAKESGIPYENFIVEEPAYDYIAFTKSDIFGNPHFLIKNIPQKKLFKYPYEDIHEYPFLYIVWDNSLNEIFKKCELSFGYDINTVTKTPAKLYYNKDGKGYDPTKDVPQVFLQYFNTENNQLYSCYNPENKENVDIYLYNKDYPSSNIPKEVQELLGSSNWMWLQSDYFYSIPGLVFSLFATNLNFKGVIKEGEEDDYITSDTLTIYNEIDNSSSVTMNDIALICSDSGMYAYYGTNGQIQVGQNTTRTLTVRFASDTDIDMNKYNITWEYPTKHTGLVVSAPANNSTTLSYTLSNSWFSDQVDNTITCTVMNKEDDKEVYTASYNFSFGYYQTYGTSYRLNVDFDGFKKFFQPIYDNDEGILSTKVGNNLLNFKAWVERVDGTVPQIDLNDVQFTWGFYNNSNIFYSLSTDKNVNYFVLTDKTEEHELNGRIESYYELKLQDDENHTIRNFLWTSESISATNNFIDKIAKNWMVTLSVTASFNGISITEYLPIPLYHSIITASSISPTDTNLYLYGPNRLWYNSNGSIDYNRNTPYTFSGASIHYNTTLQGISGTTPIHELRQDDGLYYLSPKKDNTGSLSLMNVSYNIRELDGNSNPYQYPTRGFVVPIVTLNNLWDSDKLNNWNGTQEITENQIFSTDIIVGTKSQINNSFSGVVFKNGSSTGIWNYKNGKVTFKVNTNGSFSALKDSYYIKFAQQNDAFEVKAKNFQIDREGAMILSKVSLQGGILYGNSSNFIIGGIDRDIKMGYYLSTGDKLTPGLQCGANGGTLFGNWTAEGIFQVQKTQVYNDTNLIANINARVANDIPYLNIDAINANYHIRLRINQSTKVLITSAGGALNGTWTPSNWSSDSRLKHNITPLEDKYNIMFDNLIPVSYQYNNGTSGRLHTGFEAQKVVEAIEKANLTTQDFAGVMLVDNPDKKYYGDYDKIWFLRRDEFVALNTWQIQLLKQRVTLLENEIKELKNNEIN